MSKKNYNPLELLMFSEMHLRQNAAALEIAPVLCVGNFDGAHRGHAALVQEARQLAAKRDANVLALSFAPHPRRFFKPDAPFFQLTPPDLRQERLGAIGFHGLAEFRFDAVLANMEAADFVREILVSILHASGVVVGADFHFGKDRKGTPDYLAQAARVHGFDVRFVSAFRDENGEIVSSTAIRKALAEGELLHANRMLGYSFDVTGPVVHGAKRGRELGYPTANIVLDPGCDLKHGIYAVRVLVDGKRYAGVASFGRRPMFDNGAPLLEVFVLDFAGDLYGKTLRVSFEAFLRGEEKFDNLEALIVQMDADQARARSILGAQ